MGCLGEHSLKSEFLYGNPRQSVTPCIGLNDPSVDLLTHPVLMPRSRSSSIFLVGLWHGLRSERTAQPRPAWDPAHIVWVHLGKPAGFTMVETNPDRRLHCSRVGCEVRVVGITLADTRLKGDELLAIRDSFMCVAVHPCRVNKTIRIAVSAVMDYLESCT